MEPESDWPAQVAHAVGRAVAYYRQQARDENGRKMSVRELSERCAKLGLPMARPTLTKLENGHRETITVPELLVLARALGVPPAQLVIPIGRADAFEMLPGYHESPWEALLWFSGMAPGAPRLVVFRTASAVQLYQGHASWAERYQAYDGETRIMVVDSIRLARATMRERGLIPPPLTGELAAELGDEEEAADGPR